MRSAAAAIAWEFRQRHRWGLRALVAYVIVLAFIKLFVLEPGQRIDFADAQSLAFAVVVPLTATFMYFLAVFSFGLSGDLAARRSMFPSRMFTLPVTSSALAAWPMIYGAAAMALLWLFMRGLSLWPAGMDVPVLWPGVMAVSLLAWTQALTWLPYPLRGMRVIVAVIWLTMIDAAVMIALESKAPEWLIVAILAPQAPLAYLTAWFAIARARRGDDFGVRRLSRRFESGGRATALRNADHAQVWFEWRQHGRSLPALVAILLPFQLALLFPFRETPLVVFEVLAGVLLTPPFMAVFVAATVSKSSDSYGLTPFIATRPLTNASLVAAKLKVAMASTLAAWLLVALAIPIAVRLSRTTSMVMGWIRGGFEFFGTPRAIVVALLIVSALLVATWKQLVQSLCVGMTGREWLIKGSVFGALVFISFFLPIAHWMLTDRSLIMWTFFALAKIAAVLVFLKLAAGAWVAMRLHGRGLLSDRALLTGAAWWCAGALALYALLVWLVPGIVVRSYLVGMLAILAMPLARLAAAPLAVAVNRHQ